MCDDPERERNWNEWWLRSIRKFGQLSQELEKAQGTRTELHPNDGKKSKVEQLAEAGISTATAQRYEQLAGPLEAQARSTRLTWL